MLDIFLRYCIILTMITINKKITNNKLLYNENNGFDKLLFKNILKMKGDIYVKFLL